MNFNFKQPSYILFILLSIIYFLCGYAVGFYQGYYAGQKDYSVYINEVFEGD